MQRRRPSPLQTNPFLSLLSSILCLVFVVIGPVHDAWSGSIDASHPIPVSLPNQSVIPFAPASPAPVIIQNFRVLRDSEKTRLVLDLDRQARAIERKIQNPSRVVIALPNAWLSQPAQMKATDGTVSSPFTIMQSTSHAIAVSIPTTSFRTYKHFALSNPPRLVIDVTPPIDHERPSLGESLETSHLPITPITQPIVPRSKRYTTIVIDPGHGGKDPGAHGSLRTLEKDVTLKVGLQLKELLRKQPGVRVLMTRDHDVYVELEERARFANDNEADLFVSIHVNSHPSRLVKGVEIYHFGEAKDHRALEVAARENGTPINSTGVGWEYLVADLLATKKVEASLELAWNAKEAMVAHMARPYAVTDHGVKTAPFYVLRFTSMPSILAEIAYISNPTEEDLLRKPMFIKDVAQSLHQGIVSFLASTK